MEKSPRDNKKKPRKLLDQVRDALRLKDAKKYVI